jgi:phospholipid/cholesterol/gamma-HCH transport system ATP-binding protein
MSAPDPSSTPAAAPAAGATIRYEDVTVTLGGRRVLEGLSCELPAGRISVILGMSGAGKSVMMRLALGLLRPDRGRVLVDGKDLARLPAAELLALRRDFGVAFQGGALFSALDVAENVAFPLRELSDLPEDAVQARVRDLLARVGLSSAAELRVDELSGGMQKRVAFARAIALHPRVVFLDEPSSGLDPIIAARIDAVIRRLHQDSQATYFVITHDIASARAIAHHVGVLDRGRLALFMPAEQFWSSPDPIVEQLVERKGVGPIQPADTQEGETVALDPMENAS